MPKTTLKRNRFFNDGYVIRNVFNYSQLSNDFLFIWITNPALATYTITLHTKTSDESFAY
jgi:hypothetical protein